ncbi:hypothetical protein BDZ88DRAFT_419237 [Geranomyces variabilis]|nr:hypothetical protein BDZ88DRAFT_419237 [Geranomyces variabilis]
MRREYLLSQLLIVFEMLNLAGVALCLRLQDLDCIPQNIPVTCKVLSLLLVKGYGLHQTGGRQEYNFLVLSLPLAPAAQSFGACRPQWLGCDL